MAYLSRIWINPRRRQGRRLLGDPHAMHAAVLDGIPAQPVTERMLWRVDVDNPHRPALLVLTRSLPSWEHIVEQAGWPSARDPDDPQVLVRTYDPLLRRVQDGSEFAFRLTANPVRATKPSAVAPRDERSQRYGRERSKRHGHVTLDQQVQWLTSRAERFGFRIPESSASAEMNEPVPDLRITRRERHSFRRSNSTSAPVMLRTVTYEGRVVVTDAPVFQDRLLSGFGPAKAYGCGLMTLAPVTTP